VKGREVHDVIDGLCAAMLEEFDDRKEVRK
jgi:hypothetical protein